VDNHIEIQKIHLYTSKTHAQAWVIKFRRQSIQLKSWIKWVELETLHAFDNLRWADELFSFRLSNMYKCTNKFFFLILIVNSKQTFSIRKICHFTTFAIMMFHPRNSLENCRKYYSCLNHFLNYHNITRR